MDSAIAFYVGSMTFVIMMGIKIPVKKVIFLFVKHAVSDESRRDVIRKRCNAILFPVVFLVASVWYYCVLRILGIEHFKWCCSLKAGAIAIAIYAVYEQWFCWGKERK